MRAAVGGGSGSGSGLLPSGGTGSRGLLRGGGGGLLRGGAQAVQVDGNRAETREREHREELVQPLGAQASGQLFEDAAAHFHHTFTCARHTVSCTSRITSTTAQYEEY